MRDKLQDFRLSPGPQVWKQVEAALPEEKRKRRFIFWWLLPLGLLVGAGTWYVASTNQKDAGLEKPFVLQNGGVADDEKPEQASPSTDAVKTTDQLAPKTETTSKSPVIVEPVTRELPEQPVEITAAKDDQKQEAVNRKNAIIVTNKNVVPKPINPEAKPLARKTVPLTKEPLIPNNSIALKTATSSKHRTLQAIKSTPANATGPTAVTPNPNDQLLVAAGQKNPVIANPDEAAGKLIEGSVVDDGKVVKSGTPATIIIPKNGGINEMQKDSTAVADVVNQKDLTIKNGTGKEIEPSAVFNESKTNAAEKNGSLANDNSASLPVNNAVPVVAKKRSNKGWQFFVAAGISNANSKLFGVFNSMEKSLYAPPLNQNVGNSPAAMVSPVRATAGFSYAIGVERLQSISRHWKWYAAVQYGFLSNHQKTGLRKDSAISVFDNSLFSNSNNRSNTVVPGFYYSGSTAQHINTVHQLGLQTGLQYSFKAAAKRPFSIRAGFLINQQFATHQLLYDANKNAYYYSSAATNYFTTGALIGFDWKMARWLSAGAFFQYNFTKISKVETSSSALHWQMSGVKIAIPIRKL
ncbi:MAG: hypothetical protein V4722_09720 [Bacteroidota bacterium]